MRISKYRWIFVLLILVLINACASSSSQNSAKLNKKAPKLVENLAPHYSIKINLPARQLYLMDHGRLVKTYDVAVGQARFKTPSRNFYIHQIIWRPWWIPPASDWAKNAKPTPPGPRNPLGPVKMVMQNAFLIHGTNKPNSIGRPASHGCIRMRREDAKELAWTLQTAHSQKRDVSLQERYKKPGRRSFWVKLDQVVEVETVYERIAYKDGQLTVHPDIYGKQRNLRAAIEKVLSQQQVHDYELDAAKLRDLHRQTRRDSLTLPLNSLKPGNLDMQIARVESE